MSLSGTVKEALSRQISTARHCRIAETAALLSLCGRFTADGALRMQTENSAVIRKYFTLVQKTFNIETEIAVREHRQMKKGHIYYVEIKDDALIRTVLLGTKLSREQNSGGTLVLNTSLLTQQTCCKRAFIRGAFLASGSISDPDKGYHFEIVCPDERKAGQLQELIRSFGIDAQVVVRKTITCGLCERRRTDRGYPGCYGGECGADESGEYPDPERNAQHSHQTK